MRTAKTRMSRDDEKQSGAALLIKRYRNRRLFNTQTGAYIDFDHLTRLAKSGIPFDVHDAPTGRNITCAILTRIVLEEDCKGQALLPIKFLRNVIRLQTESLR